MLERSRESKFIFFFIILKFEQKIIIFYILSHIAFKCIYAHLPLSLMHMSALDA